MKWLRNLWRWLTRLWSSPEDVVLEVPTIRKLKARVKPSRALVRKRQEARREQRARLAWLRELHSSLEWLDLMNRQRKTVELARHGKLRWTLLDWLSMRTMSWGIK